MVGSLGVLVIAIMIALSQVPALLKKNMKKESILFILILSLGTILNIFLVFNIPIPNPLDLLLIVFKPISDKMELFLK
jgi:hypothetical protein